LLLGLPRGSPEPRHCSVPNAAQRAADAKASQLEGQEVWFKRGGDWVQGVLRFVSTGRTGLTHFARWPIRVEGMRGPAQWYTEGGARKLLAAGEARPGALAAVALQLPVEGAILGVVAAVAFESGGAGPVAARKRLDAFEFGSVEGCLAARAGIAFGGSAWGWGRQHSSAGQTGRHPAARGGGVVWGWGAGVGEGAVAAHCELELWCAFRLPMPPLWQHSGGAGCARAPLSPQSDGTQRVGPSAPCLPSFYEAQNKHTMLGWAVVFVPAGMDAGPRRGA
jgi:hypothetical protein